MTTWKVRPREAARRRGVVRYPSRLLSDSQEPGRIYIPDDQVFPAWMELRRWQLEERCNAKVRERRVEVAKAVSTAPRHKKRDVSPLCQWGLRLARSHYKRQAHAPDYQKQRTLDNQHWLLCRAAETRAAEKQSGRWYP